jgi:hypothetical protein
MAMLRDGSQSSNILLHFSLSKGPDKAAPTYSSLAYQMGWYMV